MVGSDVSMTVSTPVSMILSATIGSLTGHVPDALLGALETQWLTLLLGSRVAPAVIGETVMKPIGAAVRTPISKKVSLQKDIIGGRLNTNMAILMLFVTF